MGGWPIPRTVSSPAWPSRPVPRRRSPSVGYLGVVPELRGHRYVDDLVAEITRFHATAGAPRVTGTTVATNLPMAAAFERAGYRNTDIRMVLSAPPATAAAKERRLVQ